MDVSKKAKAGKLAKLAMPKKRQEEDMLDLEQEQEDPLDEMQSDEMPASDEPSDLASDASGLSDEELMAELKKRGLMSKLGEEEAGEDDEALA